jgi:Poly(ADP-ribose) polymerase and DNA-Ligase Zn-finger region
MPDLIEKASSGRAKCRRCGEKIDKDALRFGESVPNPFGEGDAIHWFHLACAAEKRPAKLQAALEAYGEVPEQKALEPTIEAGLKNPKLVQVKHAERAPTGRASCQECHEKIDKGALRVAIEREADVAGMATTSYLHLGCAPNHVGREGLSEKLRRTSTGLESSDLAEIESALPP